MTFYNQAIEDVWSLDVSRDYASSLDFDIRRHVFDLLTKKGAHSTLDDVSSRAWMDRITDVFTNYSLRLEKKNSDESLTFKFRHVEYLEGSQLQSVTVPLATTYKALGFDFEAQDCDGMTCVTALSFLVSHRSWLGYINLLYGILLSGFCANSRTIYGQNGLHMALYGTIRARTTAEWYLHHDKIQNGERTDFNILPDDINSKTDLNNIVRLLLMFDCDLLAIDSDNRTPNQLADSLSTEHQLDISSVWREALRVAGVNASRLELVERSSLTEAYSSSTDATDINFPRRRKPEPLPASTEPGANVNSQNLWLCLCIHCDIERSHFPEGKMAPPLPTEYEVSKMLSDTRTQLCISSTPTSYRRYQYKVRSRTHSE